MTCLYLLGRGTIVVSLYAKKCKTNITEIHNIKYMGNKLFCNIRSVSM